MADKDVLANKKVFFVEDDLFFANMVSEKLSQYNCALIHATNGADAMTMLEKETPDLILLDLMLPGGMDGFAILEKIKATKSISTIPVIILSNLNSVEDIERCMKLGAFRYLVKALVSPSEIVENIESTLTSRVPESH